MEILGLDHLVITTQNLTACLHFYVDVLGMELESAGGRYALRFGSQKINIHQKKGEFLPAARHVTYGSADICLLAKGPIEAVEAELLEKGAVIELGIVPRTGALGVMESVYLRDSDENLVEISVY